jgi:hypothetical protein
MSDFQAERHGTAQDTYYQFVGGVLVEVGIAINTPDGIMVWGHDFGKYPDAHDLADGDWLPTLLGTVVSFEKAAELVRDHTQKNLPKPDTDGPHESPIA